MLDFMRRTSSSLIMYVLLGGIIVVFAVNFGPGSGSCSSADPNYAAVVDGEVIRQQEFAVLYGQRVDQMKRVYGRGGTQITDDLLQKLGVRRQVIDGLIDGVLMAHQASQRGLVVSDEELLLHLKERYGLDDGVSADQYESWVNSVFRMPVWRFEDRVRSEILGSKIANVVRDVPAVSDGELKETYFREHNRAKITYVKFSASDAQVPEPASAQVKKLIADDIDSVKAKFEATRQKYQTPKEVTVRQILVRPEDATDPKSLDNAKQHLMSLRKKISTGSEFANLAKEHSQDERTKENGGLMGTFRRGQMLKALEEASFSLNAGETSAEPVQTRLGLHLLYVEKVMEATERSFEQVESEVAAAILRERSAEVMAKSRAEAMLSKLHQGKEIDDLTKSEDGAAEGDAKQSKPMRVETPWILESVKAIPRIGLSDSLHEGIFSLTDEKPLSADVYQVGSAYYVVKLLEREIANEVRFNEEKSDLRSGALSEKQDLVLRDWLKHLREQADIELNPALFGVAG